MKGVLVAFFATLVLGLAASDAVGRPQVQSDPFLGSTKGKSGIGSLQSFETRSDVPTTTISVTIQAIYTHSFATVGDRGGAHYKRASSQPDHAGRIRSADRFLPDGKIDNLNGGWWELAEPTVNVFMLGAKCDSTGTGTGTDDKIAFQNAIDAAIALRKKLHIPGCSYRIGSALLVDRSAITDSRSARLTIEGDGRGATLLNFDPGPYVGLEWRAGTADSGSHALFAIRGLYLRKTDHKGSGLKVTNAAFFTVDDVYASGWNFGVDLEDCLSARLSGVISRFNRYGFRALRKDGSQPNAISLYSPVLGNNIENGLLVTNGGNFNVFGGSVESNGATGNDVTKGGIYYSGGPSQAGVGLSMFGVYVENNKGSADILIANSSGNAGAFSFEGNSFQRINRSNFTTNIVRVTGTTPMVLSFKGNAFKRLGTYSADISRKYIDINSARDVKVALDRSNYQMDAVESWCSDPVPTSGCSK